MSLVERIEGASGPDREIDGDIHAETGGYEKRWSDTFQAFLYWRDDRWIALGSIPAYTSSIDAALTLVPEEMRDEIEITTLYQVARVTINMNHGPDGSPFYGNNESNSIPLAICAAALKAREASNG